MNQNIRYRRAVSCQPRDTAYVITTGDVSAGQSNIRDRSAPNIPKKPDPGLPGSINRQIADGMASSIEMSGERSGVNKPDRLKTVAAIPARTRRTIDIAPELIPSCTGVFHLLQLITSRDDIRITLDTRTCPAKSTDFVWKCKAKHRLHHDDAD